MILQQLKMKKKLMKHLFVKIFNLLMNVF